MSYWDINLNFIPHPLTGDMTFIKDENAVKRSMVHVANTMPYDIPFQPELHGHIRELLFELPTDATVATIEQRIRWAIQKLEPRAEIKSIDAQLTADEAGYRIVVSFDVISLIEPQTLEFYLERVR